MDSPDARCALVAAEQHGCVSLEQALTCGLSRQAVRRRVDGKRWRRLQPRVYAIRGAPGTWEQRLFAAILWAGEGAMASHASAAALWQLPEFQQGPVEISHPGTKQSRQDVIVHRVFLDPGDVTSLRVFPLTTPARTLVDIAGRVRERELDAALHYCIHRRLTTLRSLRDAATRCRSGHPGVGRLRKALEIYAADDRPPASPLEARFARLLHASRIPPPLRQHQVVVDGRYRYLDFAWPDAQVAVEVDGYRWHSSRHAWQRDRTRLSGLRRAGWTVIHATHDDIHQKSGELLEELARLLR